MAVHREASDDRGHGHADAALPAELTAEIAHLIGRRDHVTRLPNRMQFLDDFPRLAAEPATLAMVTLAEAQHYNRILRALGHAFAEGFVREGAATLGQLVPARTAIYHVSVLSFAFVAPTIAENDGAAFVDRIVTQFVKALRVEDIPIKTEVGVGLTALAASDDPSEILRAALTAAQDSRRNGKGWAWYDHRTDAAHRRAFQLLSDLPEAIASGQQLKLHSSRAWRSPRAAASEPRRCCAGPTRPWGRSRLPSSSRSPSRRR